MPLVKCWCQKGWFGCGAIRQETNCPSIPKPACKNAILQGPVSGLILGKYVLAFAQLLPQVSHLLAEGRVLLLQERGPDGDLVLLQPPGVAGALGSHVVLSAPCPVLVILLISYRREKKNKILDFSKVQGQPGHRQAPGLCRGANPGFLACVSFLDSFCMSESVAHEPHFLSGARTHQSVPTGSYSLPSRGVLSEAEIKGWMESRWLTSPLNDIPTFFTLPA